MPFLVSTVIFFVEALISKTYCRSEVKKKKKKKQLHKIAHPHQILGLAQQAYSFVWASCMATPFRFFPTRTGKQDKKQWVLITFLLS